MPQSCLFSYCFVFTGGHILLQALQALHPLQAPQFAQLPPQEDFPAFLSRIIPRISSAVISTMTAISTMLMRLAESQANTGSHP